MLNPELTEAQLETQVRDYLEDFGDADVDVTMEITGDDDNRTAQLIGSYTPALVIPMLSKFRITYQSAVSTSLRSVDE